MKKVETSRNVYITKPFLPPLEEFIPLLESIWSSRNVTNNGVFSQSLEDDLSRYFGVNHVSLVSNATIGLILSLKALDITGEVITTPFSFMATSNAILWAGLQPVYADINHDSFNLDPYQIESLITEKTSAIMPVHCYGNPCDVDAISTIANKYNLKIIYDAAHAFGVKKDKVSILTHGDFSVLSFHGTKVFNTFEGGLIVSKNKILKDKVDRLRNFGIDNEFSASMVGINGKMSEFNAALGCLQLKYIDSAIAKRKVISDLYTLRLAKNPGIKVPNDVKAHTKNYAYYPIIITDTYPISIEVLIKLFNHHEIYPRRYFYPLITDLESHSKLVNTEEAKKRLKNAIHISDRVLCLPIYPELEDSTVDKIISIINGCK